MHSHLEELDTSTFNLMSIEGIQGLEIVFLECSTGEHNGESFTTNHYPVKDIVVDTESVYPIVERKLSAMMHMLKLTIEESIKVAGKSATTIYFSPAATLQHINTVAKPLYAFKVNLEGGSTEIWFESNYIIL